MASRLPPKSPVLLPLSYSAKFDYPLTAEEIWFWQINTEFSRAEIKKLINKWQMKNGEYCYLPSLSRTVALRRRRRQYSRGKWTIARRIARSIARIPSVSAVFITGSLAMDNCKENDDIDLMIVTLPGTLWITRFFLFLYLFFKSLRRPPYLSEHSSPRVSDKICDNLYLDLDHLYIDPHPKPPTYPLYVAHEILQTVPVVDKHSVHHRFLLANPWVGGYLPVAYRESLKKYKYIKLEKLNAKWQTPIGKIVYIPVNLLFYLLQYLYMKPHITQEKIGPGYAFFHPNTDHGTHV
ncbi:MAG: hypothetical protein UY28_C0005G0002 [Candidatus Amesbacteria bacterium GW2011_GWB1_48_13]|uniref:Polymerase nucleotidyl transferase domain-containing protein n=1 Tax=Candidatus Amesbacteria bacterium GW2011_GWB1_48_13 TaxID=1618362 RepID=A0A0G1UVQ4_9BACT|nr:MAG: hypothetical protein UY28_C0005G0002 [Candidatus Amesbacteria bacterium GW2011_GWB1_48_13]